ncbi:MAG: hypothetical protein AAFR54_17395 [Planctomycetota bacterium]
MRAALTLLALAALAVPGSAASRAGQTELGGVGDEPLRNGVALPAARAAEEALTEGDAALAEWRAGAGPDRLRRAFDRWRSALAGSQCGDGVRALIPGAAGGALPDPDGIRDRRADGVIEAVVRRLAALEPGDRRGWTERFGPESLAALEAALTKSAAEASERLARLERATPLTPGAFGAAVALADLALEDGRPVAARSWLARAERHAALGGLDPRRAALGLRARAADVMLARPQGVDHSMPVRDARPRRPDAEPPALLAVRAEVLAVMQGAAADPLGRGLGSGVCALRDGTVFVQSAVALLVMPAGGGAVRRRLTERALGVGRMSIQATAASGGWTSLPATNGEICALVHGRAERPRQFLDITGPAVGNVLGVVGRGAPGEALRALWTLRDGVRIDAPQAPLEGDIDPARPAPLGAGVPVDGWDLGRGWEFQPGPVMADGAIFVLARGLGDPTDEETSHADEVRLFAIEADGSAVRWSREITSERNPVEDAGRGRASLYAATTMPLTLDRRTGTIVAGTNVGLVSAWDAADGRMLWAFRRQRAASGSAGFAGSRGPLLAGLAFDRLESGAIQVSRAAWVAPLASEFAYLVPTGLPPATGELLVEPPRPAGRASVLADARGVGLDPSSSALLGDDLALLGRSGRFDALLLDRALHPARGRSVRQIAAAFAAPGDVFTGLAARAGGLLFAATDSELMAFDPSRDYALVGAAPLEDQQYGRGGNVFAIGQDIWVAGRNTVWVFRTAARGR